MEIKKGDKFLCKESVVMYNGAIDYIKGKVYTSDLDGCITDEEGTVKHWWGGDERTSEYFVRWLVTITLTKDQWSIVVREMESYKNRMTDDYNDLVRNPMKYLSAGCDEEKYRGFVELSRKKKEEAERISLELGGSL